jgi:hypothetical protein
MTQCLPPASHSSDGLPTKDVLQAIADEHAIMLDTSLIRKLSDFEGLVASDS